MKYLFGIWAIFLLLLGTTSTPAEEQSDILRWDQFAHLPPAKDQQTQLGLADPFGGLHNNALIIAGGSNFPDGPPWDGGKKYWWDDIYVLEKTGTQEHQWHVGFKLPKPLAHGASVTTEHGVICIGGCDAERCYSNVFKITWDVNKKTVTIETLPSLPEPSAFHRAVVLGNTLFVAGGQSTMAEASATNRFWSLDLTEGSEWKALPSWNGAARILPVLAVQDFQESKHLYLFSGRDFAPGQDAILLKDVHRYDPSRQIWTRLSDAPRCLMAGTAVDFGAQHILLIGGDDGENWGKDLRDTHPGFSKDMLYAYHTLTDTWVHHGTLPQNHVTTSLIKWDGSLIIPTGEIRPAVRSPIVWKATPLKAQQVCQTLDYVVVVFYLLALVGVGIYCARRENTTEDFFLAGRRIPWWAAGLSIFGTQLSAITFMAIPAKTYSTNWLAFLFNMGIVAITPLIVFFFLPFYRRLNVTTAYEYLERRFSLAVRFIGSALFLAFQLGRIGIVLLLPSLALSVVTGVNVYLCILIMGVLATVYTVMGGIEAVIWTDVLQVFVLVGGALWCLVYAVAHVGGGVSGAVSMALAENKFHWIDSSWDLGRLTIWVIVFGWVNSLLPYASDQTVIQRYLTTKDENAARKAIWTNAILTVPASLLFFSLGTALFVFYKTHPSHLDPGMAKVDNILPWFVMRELPAGVSGLVIAALFAASMSTLDSSMNSMATAVISDFYRKLKTDPSERRCLLLARILTAVFGALGVLLAMVFAATEFKSLWDQFVMIIGLLGGGLGGLFILGVFTKRGNSFGAVTGLIAGAVMQYLAKQNPGLHGYLYAGIGLVSCVLVGYLASLCRPDRGKNLNGLTAYTMPDKL